MKNKIYINCHSHTDFSNLKFPDSINTVSDLIDGAYELNMAGVAITDHDCVSSYVKAGEHIAKRRKENPGTDWDNFKVIYGNEIYLCRNGLNQHNFIKGEDKYFHFILLAKDEIGNRQIRELSTRAWEQSYMYFHRRVPTYFSDLEDIIQKDPGHVIASSACFRAGTQIETRLGWKNIEEIQSGDEVINRYGKWEKVNYPTSRNFQGSGYELELRGHKKRIICTENHKFLVITNKGKNPRWVEAKDLSTKMGSSKHILLSPTEVVETNEDVIKREEWENSYLPYFKVNPRRKRIKKEFKLTPEVMRFFGLFLGDGSISLSEKTRSVGIHFNIKEFETYWNSFVYPASQEIGIEWNIRRRPENNRVDITSGTNDIVDLFYYLFGNVTAGTKYVPKRLRVSEKLDQELVFGYMLADGYFRERKKDGYKYGEFVTASISQQLSHDMWKILNSLKIRSSIYLNKGRVGKNGVNHQDSWYISGSIKSLGEVKKNIEYSPIQVEEIFNQAREQSKHEFLMYEDTLYRKIRIAAKNEIVLNEKVYCLNNNTHSFKAEDVIVHNCLGGQLPFLIMKAKEYSHRPDMKEAYEQAILRWISKIQSIFGKENFYFELQPALSEEQIYVNKELIHLSKELDIKCIITTDAHYLKQDGREIHKAYLNSKEGEREVDAFYEATYLMDAAELWERMKTYLTEEDFDAMLQNTLDIGNQCENYDILKPLHLPYIPREHKDQTLRQPITVQPEDMPNFFKFYNSDEPADRQLAIRIHNYLTDPSTYGDYLSNFKVADYELGIIWESGIAQKVSWSRYLLQMADYCDIIWNEGDSLICPARGSAGASYVMYILGIIQIDKTREKAPLLFERFINPERASVLDVDIDVESTKRNRVIAAMQAVYGEDRVVRVCTFKTEKAKSAILSSGRGLGIDVDTTRYIASLIGSERGIQHTLKDMYFGNEEKELKPNPTFVSEMNKYPKLWNVAQRIEGLINGVGIHAGGIVILDEPLTNRCAVMTTTKGVPVSSFDLHDAEKTGLIKIDLLATEGLSKIRTTLDLLIEYDQIDPEPTLRQTYEKTIGIYNIERNDPKMWEMVWNNEIISLFQMEQQSGIQGIALARPRSLEDLATINSVMRLMASERGAEQPLNKYARFRENLTAWDQEMVRFGLNEEERELLHNILNYSSGICAHQEDLYTLLTHPKIAGWSLGKADQVRKAVAKKNPKEYNELEKEFFETVQKRRTCSPSLASYVWRVLIATQRGYSFKILKPYMVTYK